MLKSLLAGLFRKRQAPAPDQAAALEAILADAVRLHRAGELAAAEAAYREVERLQPDHADAIYLRGVAALQRADHALAVTLLRRACALAPRNAIYLNHLGEALRHCDDLSGAIEVLESAVALDPNSSSAWNNLGAACIDLGLAARAIESYRKAIALKPGSITVHSNLLFALNLVPGIGNAERYAQHLQWAGLHADPLTPARTGLPPRAGRRLRIGYVSPDFRAHAMAPFVLPILECHDRERFEVFAYSSTSHPDATTAALRALVDCWRDISALEDEAAAARIRADRVDILVDLAGHTNGNRLRVFARKPAPAQVTMLGYPFSTGMAAMDYRVTDAVADADPGANAYNRERLLYMPDSLWCFRPQPAMPALTPLPAMANGHVTFASLNNPVKLNDALIETWAKILQRVPGSRLQLMLVGSGPARDQLLHRFSQLGVDPARIVTHKRAATAQFWRLAQDCDIALDPFPCNGGATTCESLWLGLPVVALVGEHFVARASFSILSAATLGGLACPDQDAYVERACALAGDIDALAAMRAGMRDRLQSSPLRDERKYVGALESLLLDAWDRGLGPDRHE